MVARSSSAGCRHGSDIYKVSGQKLHCFVTCATTVSEYVSTVVEE